MVEYMLTTDDNPFDPFTQFDEWNVYDELSGYYTLAYLGRIVKTSDEISEADQRIAIEQAIDECVAENIGGHYIKVASTTAQVA